MVWFLLSVAGLCEAGFYICLSKTKLASGNLAVFWFTGFLSCLILCISLLHLVMQALPVIEVFVIWQLIGITGLVLTEIFFFKRKLNYWPLLLIILTIGSILSARLIYENVT